MRVDVVVILEPGWQLLKDWTSHLFGQFRFEAPSAPHVSVGKRNGR
jgi:hypothetical protein